MIRWLPFVLVVACGGNKDSDTPVDGTTADSGTPIDTDNPTTDTDVELGYRGALGIYDGVDALAGGATDAAIWAEEATAIPDRMFGSPVVRLGDLDGDGLEDLAVGNGTHTYVMLRSAEMGADWVAAGVFLGFGQLLAVGDVVGNDGLTDVIRATTDTVELLSGADLALSPARPDPYATIELADVNIFQIDPADYNGDGQLDVVLAHSQQGFDSTACWFDGRLFTEGAVVAEADGSCATITGILRAAADIDGDSLPDLLGYSERKVVLMPAAGIVSGLFAGAPIIELNGEIEDFSLGEVNGDGITDLVAVRSPNAEVFLGPFTDTMKTTADAAQQIDFNAAYIELMDIDGDGQDEMLMQGHTSATLVTSADLPLDGSTVEPIRWTTTPDEMISVHFVPDLTGDGKPDLAIGQNGDEVPVEQLPESTE